MADAEVVERIVSCVGDLPAMPAIVAEVLKATDDPKSDIARISDVIQSDPAMTAKILRVSNSSYYGMKQYVGTLKLAAVILGVREIRNIVLGISVFESIKDDKMDAALVQDIWDASLKVAAIAKKLGESMGLGLQGEEFISGILCNIGKVVLLSNLKKIYPDILRKYGNDWQLLCREELQELGCDHADLAMALAVRWNLPQGLADALWLQYPRPETSLEKASSPSLAAVLRIAKAAVNDNFDSEEPLACLHDAEAWDILEQVKNPIPRDQRRNVLQELILGLKDLPSLL